MIESARIVQDFTCLFPSDFVRAGARRLLGVQAGDLGLQPAFHGIDGEDPCER